MRVCIVTENFIQPWSPNDIETFLGGSQECVVLLAEALSKRGHSVQVMTHGPTPVGSEERKGIPYTQFSEPIQADVAILFKVNPLTRKPPCKVIFWSSDVQEKIPGIVSCNAVVCLTMYHLQRNGWKSGYVIPHGIDFESLDRRRKEKIPNTVLYCSSPDRGLEDLLQNWHLVRKHFPKLTLTITYGFRITRQISSELGRNIADHYEENVRQECKRVGIRYLGDVSRQKLEELYWESEYWILPLNNADSELFCFNAVKSAYTRCIPIVNKIGALTETVRDYIPFTQFIQGDLRVVPGRNIVPMYTWEEVAEMWGRVFPEPSKPDSHCPKDSIESACWN